MESEFQVESNTLFKNEFWPLVNLPAQFGAHFETGAELGSSRPARQEKNAHWTWEYL